VDDGAEQDENTRGESAARELRELATRLAVLPESAMRASSLAEALEARSPEDAAWLLDGLATAGRAGGPPFDVSLLAAVELASGDRLSYEQRRAIFDAAERLRLESCKELLFSAAVPDDDDELAAAPRALIPGSRPLTLGERKSLARSWHRNALERLLVDPHPDVVGLVLSNPRITEDEVLRIATGRRSTARVLQLIFDSPRWSVRPRVRRALLRNPRIPVALALRLVGLLNMRELRDLSSDGERLPLPVLAAVRRRLKPRS
jgi:hypothetical protein